MITCVLFTAANSDSLNKARALIEDYKPILQHANSISAGSCTEATSEASQHSVGNDKQQRCRKLLQTMSCEKVSYDMYTFL